MRKWTWSFREGGLLGAGGCPPVIPLHASLFLNGHDDYKEMDIQDRKRLLQTFFMMLQPGFSVRLIVSRKTT